MALRKARVKALEAVRTVPRSKITIIGMTEARAKRVTVRPNAKMKRGSPITAQA